jgi:formylglycine-generating enzyme required for sulfatase activity
MAGNIWEWCVNEHKNPERPEAVGIHKGAGQRVVRGGSWNGAPGDLRVSDRDRDFSDDRGSFLGFRLVQDLP